MAYLQRIHLPLTIPGIADLSLDREMLKRPHSSLGYRTLAEFARVALTPSYGKDVGCAHWENLAAFSLSHSFGCGLNSQNHLCGIRGQVNIDSKGDPDRCLRYRAPFVLEKPELFATTVINFLQFHGF